jgi:undecaprenyl-diphosphatase
MFSLQPRFLIPLAAAFTFLGLAIFIASGRDFTFDTKLVLMLRQAGDPATPLGPAWLREAMRDVTALGSFVGLGLMTIAAALTLWLCSHRPLAVGLVVSVLSATLVSTLLKIAIGRERPDIVEHVALTFTASFPSGHAFLSAVTLLCIAGFVGLSARREHITRLCIILAWVMIVLIGVSRVYLGVHWPTDVLAGWCLGVAWSSVAVAWLGRGMAAAEQAGLHAVPARSTS